MNIKDFSVFPAIHIRNGEVVRFTQGDINNPIVFHTDPVACAQQWIDQGADWLQLINLDAAFNEDATNNWNLIEKICALNVNIQFGGGIRNMDDVHWAVRSGIKRVIIGTAAVENPRLMADAIAAYGADVIILGIDADEDGEVKINGWKSGGGVQATSLAIQMRQLGITTAIHTSIHQDGSMTGVDLQASIELAELSHLNIIVGGGIGCFEDVLDCFNNNSIKGVIIGKALYTGVLDLKKTLQAVRHKYLFESALPRWKADQNTHWARFSYDLVENNLKNHIAVDSSPLRVLDAGGGNGLDSLAMARMSHRVELVDVSQLMLDDARANAALAGVSARINIHAIDLQNIDREFKADEFDIVLCHNVIQFLDDHTSLLKKLISLLKPGGILSLIAPNQYSMAYQSAFLKNNLDGAFEDLHKTSEFNEIFNLEMNTYRAKELIELLKPMGVSVEQHYGIRCIYNYWGDNDLKQNPVNYEKLKKLEFELSARDPYKQTARLFQLILKKA